MKNVKNLIIASALSIMAASCYAGSLVPNTSTGVSADVNFSNPGQLQAQLTPVFQCLAWWQVLIRVMRLLLYLRQAVRANNTW